MIAAVKGVLEARGVDWIQVVVGGISLRLLVPATTLEDLGKVGQQVRLHTHLQIRDDAAVLFGFSQQEALRLFQMLTSVSRVGPRTALGLLSFMRPEALATAIATGDVDAFGRGSGVGKKTATRIVLELRGRLEKEQLEALSPTTTGHDEEVASALMALGYTAAEAREAVAYLGTATQDEAVEERVRRALRVLGEG